MDVNLADILRAENNGNDLQEDDTGMRIVVCAERQDGTLYELGHVLHSAVLQHPEQARMAISRIKFKEPQ